MVRTSTIDIEIERHRVSFHYSNYAKMYTTNVQRMLERRFNFTHVCSLFLIYSFELKLYKRMYTEMYAKYNSRIIVVILYKRNFQNIKII